MGWSIANSMLVMTLFGCASTPNFEAYTVREIDRPYALPSGVSTWDILGSFGSQTTTGYPLFWKQGVSDKLTLVWIPIPFEARYQVQRSETGFWGLRMNILGNLFMRSQNFDWSPFFETSHRWILHPWLAIEVHAQSLIEIRRVGPSPNFVEQFKIGPLFQINEKIWLAPYFTVWLELGSPRSLYIGDIPDDQTSTRIRFPIILQAGVRVARQWDFAAEYQLLRLGYAAVYTNHQAFFRVSHGW